MLVPAVHHRRIRRVEYLVAAYRHTHGCHLQVDPCRIRPLKNAEVMYAAVLDDIAGAYQTATVAAVNDNAPPPAPGHFALRDTYSPPCDANPIRHRIVNAAILKQDVLCRRKISYRPVVERHVQVLESQVSGTASTKKRFRGFGNHHMRNSRRRRIDVEPFLATIEPVLACGIQLLEYVERKEATIWLAPPGFVLHSIRNRVGKAHDIVRSIFSTPSRRPDAVAVPIMRPVPVEPHAFVEIP